MIESLQLRGPSERTLQLRPIEVAGYIRNTTIERRKRAVDQFGRRAPSVSQSAVEQLHSSC